MITRAVLMNGQSTVRCIQLAVQLLFLEHIAFSDIGTLSLQNSALTLGFKSLVVILWSVNVFSSFAVFGDPQTLTE